MMGRAAVRQTDPDYFPLAVASYILGGGASSRLYGRVRDEGGLAYSVWSDLGPARYGALLVVGAQSRTPAVPKVIDLLREEMARMGREPVRDAELDLARSYLIGSFPLRLDTSAKVAGFITTVEAEGLGLDYAERYRREIAKVTAVGRPARERALPGAGHVQSRRGRSDPVRRLIAMAAVLLTGAGWRRGGGARARRARRSGEPWPWASAARRRETAFDAEWRVTNAAGEVAVVVTPFYRWPSPPGTRPSRASPSGRATATRSCASKGIGCRCGCGSRAIAMTLPGTMPRGSW